MQLNIQRRAWRKLAGRTLILVGLAGGCTGLWTGQGDNTNLRSEPNWPPQTGSYVRRWHDEHQNRAEASDFCIYLTEWYMGGQDLGPYGLHHLGDIARRMQTNQFPIVVEPHLDTQLNEKRRNVVVTALTNAGIPDADARVVVAFPQSEGLYGEEGTYLFTDMFANRSGEHRNNHGGGMGGGGGFGGNFGGGGFGGGSGGGFGGGYGGGGYGGGGYGGYGGGGYGGGRGGFDY